MAKRTTKKAARRATSKKITPGNKLTAKQRLFCELFLEYLNAGKAYREAYKVKDSTAWSAGSRLLRNVEVAEYLKEELDSRVMTTGEILNRIAAHARGDIATFIKVNDDGVITFDLKSEEARKYTHLIKKVRTRTTTAKREDGIEVTQWVEVELHDQAAALRDLGKYHKLFTDRIETHNTISIPGLVEYAEMVYGGKK